MANIIKKVGLTVSAIALGVASFTASAKDLVIGMSFQELNNPYFVVMKEALEEAAGTMNAKVYVSDAAHDVAKQINDIEDMLQKDIDILLINPTDSVGVQSAVESAKNVGVTVIAIDAQAQGPIDSFVGSKNYDAGYQSGQFLAKSIGGKGEVAILDGIPVVPILERVKGFEDAVKEFPEIKIVTKQNGKQERDTSLSVTENMIQANPNLVGIFSVNDTGALGALTAIEASGLDIKLVSVDGFPEAIDAILKDDSKFIATAAQFPRDQVRIGLGVGLARHWGANVAKETPVDIKLIEKSNAAGFSW
ncbi:ABC transporter substrate-binding protein [Thorsellia anophelis]|uniref:Ribose transport system substrate-binding protein n=1 Tax=Thorsellia anophelis DSM 18579 TaxID=1123402 RepID=A0A1I0B8H9_9GAMM|nr:ABC transporter substrate-binding protein [Thorsellia anophelis]SET03175.1 ribose transport system substrate-binding protein [Thorsellia anophelis DSM 18579]